jgi:hypothetical protein
MTNVSGRPSKRWLLVHTLAIQFSLGHTTLDWHLGLIGPSSATLRADQALILVLGATLYALWACTLALAIQGSRAAMLATLVLCAVVGLGTGLTIVFCPPPCSGAPPFGDITHLGSLVFGAWGVYESWRAFKRMQTVHARLRA